MSSDNLPKIEHFEMTQGDDKAFAITRTDSDGTPIDITGYTYWVTIKSDEHAPDSDAEIQKKVTTHTDAAAGETEIQLDAPETKPLAGPHYYDLQEKDASGSITTWMKGIIRFANETTEAT